MKAAHSGPVEVAEFDARIRPLLGRDGPVRLAVAVSGGADSLALLHLAAAWARQNSASEILAATDPLIAVTVDHRLRPESAGEAADVAKAAGALGVPHITLPWLGAKPGTGLQAAARAARYRLIHDRLRTEVQAHDRPMRMLLTAHTADDQAETVLMRLMRGSGPDGLAGMRGRTVLPIRAAKAEINDGVGPAVLPDVLTSGLTILRPLLAVPKARLIATLARLGATWVEDPSNANEAFERIRVRKVLHSLAGLGFEPAALSLSAARTARSAAALRSLADRLARCAVNHHSGSYAEIDLDLILSEPADLAIRVIEDAIKGHGGSGCPPEGPRLAQVEDLYDRIAVTSGPMPGVSLGGVLVKIVRAGGQRHLLIMREPGREGIKPMAIEPGTCRVWDGRFAFNAGSAAKNYIVKALSEQAWRGLEAEYPGLHDLALPRQARWTLPTVWRGEHLLAIPHLGRTYPTLMGPLHWSDPSPNREGAKSLPDDALLIEFSGAFTALEDCIHPWPDQKANEA